MTGFSAHLDPEHAHVLKLSGELDIAAVDTFLEQARAAVAEADPVLVIDAGDVTFIDSTGLGALVRLREHAHATGKDIALAHIPRQMSRILELTGLSRLFDDLPEGWRGHDA
jgi:anti-sigma B factor antagonist